MKRTGFPASGIVSAVFIVIGVFLLIQEEIDARTDREILSYYGDSGNRTGELVGLALVAIGALMFLWFLNTLRSRLESAGPEARALANLGSGAGTAAAALLIGAAALFAATSFAAEFFDRFEVDPNLARLGFGTGFLFLFGWVLVNCVLVVATSVVALRSDALPTWLGRVGIAAVVLAVIESFLFPVFVIPLWILVVSVVLVRQPHRVAALPDA